MVLPAQSEGEFNGLCDRFLQGAGRGSQVRWRGKDPCGCKIWHLAVGQEQYIPSGHPRIPLEGSLTWGEQWVIARAASSKTKGRAFRPTPEYIAELINRPVAMVLAYWKRVDPRVVGGGLGLSQ